jgi:hypothetical protein
MEQFPPADAAVHFEEHRRVTAAIRRGRRLAARNRPPPGSATMVGGRGSRISATDGPYVETKEQFGGFCEVGAK